jgi:HSP20 family protein
MTVKGRGTQLEVARIQSEINRLFETLLRLRGGDAGTAEPGWSPGVDVAESDENLIVEVDLPGVDPRSVEVMAENGHLNLQGRREPPVEADPEHSEVLHDERDTGGFQLSIPLYAAVNTHKAIATFQLGVFRVILPKVPNRRGAPVAIAVQVEG